jgi:hypothetical protein
MIYTAVLPSVDFDIKKVHIPRVTGNLEDVFDLYLPEDGLEGVAILLLTGGGGVVRDFLRHHRVSIVHHGEARYRSVFPAAEAQYNSAIVGTRQNGSSSPLALMVEVQSSSISLMGLQDLPSPHNNQARVGGVSPFSHLNHLTLLYLPTKPARVTMKVRDAAIAAI